MTEPMTPTPKEGLAPGELIVFDLPTVGKRNDAEPTVCVLSDVGAARVVLFTFAAGQHLKEHRTSSEIYIQVVSGAIAFEARGQRVEAPAGTLLQLESDVPHSITAVQDATVLVTMTPSPQHHSLEAEVFDTLTPLVTRPSPQT